MVFFVRFNLIKPGILIDVQQSGRCAVLQVTHVVSQSDVVKLLWANKAVLGDNLSRTVEQLELDDVSGT